MKTISVEQNTPEWLAWRANKIGASSAAATIGVCKFKTPYGLFLELTGRAPSFEGSAATEAGKAMEPKARACYEIDHDWVEMPPVCVEHPDYPEIIASLDGLSSDGKTILEIKYPSQATHDSAKAGKVPDHYYPQCQHQLMCVPEATELHYWSYRDDQGVKVIVKPDLEYQAKLLASELAFLELVKSDTPPPLTEQDAKVSDDPILLEIAKELVAQKDTGAKKHLDRLKQTIIEMGGHNKIRCGNVLVSKSITKTGKESYRLTVRAE